MFDSSSVVEAQYRGKKFEKDWFSWKIKIRLSENPPKWL